MPSRIAGHGLQLAGHTLVFLGFAGVAASVFVAGSYPATSMWVFVAAALAIGVPLMIAGGRLNSRGRGLVLGQSPEHAAREYRRSNVLLAAYLGLLWLHGLVVAAPLILRLTGPVYPSDAFIRVWLPASLLTLCVSRDWIMRPALRSIERWVLAK